jgi:hypothetical protein
MTKTDTSWQTRSLVREGAPNRQNSNFEGKKNSGQMSKIWTWHQDILTDWSSVAMWLDFDFEFCPESPSELYRQSDRRLSAKLVSTFADRGCHVVSVTDPYGRIFFSQVTPQLYSRGWVDPVPEPLLFRKSGSAGNRSQASGSVARNPDR